MSVLSFEEACVQQGGNVRMDRIDLTGCANPYGPHPSGLDAMAHVVDPNHRDRAVVLRNHAHKAKASILVAYSEYLHVNPNELLIGRGITEFLTAFRRLFKHSVVVTPDYTRTIKLFEHVPGEARDTPIMQAERIDRAMAQHRVVVVSNPRNPTGMCINSAVFASIARKHPQSLLVVDEAYADFLLGRDTMLNVSLPNVVVLRSLNKPLGLASTRTAVMWTRDARLRDLIAAQPLDNDWPISGADAILTVPSALNADWTNVTLSKLNNTAQWMGKLLEEQFPGDVAPSLIHFRFLHMRDKDAVQRLWKHFDSYGIGIRVFNPDEPGRITGARILAPTLDDWPRVAAAIKAAPKGM